MSFGGFKFGSSSTSAPAPASNSAVPSFSLTGPSPAATPSNQAQPFSFGAQPAQTGGGGQAPPSTAQGTGGGLFGGAQQPATTGAAAAQPQTGGLFGGFGAAKPAAPAGGTGLFGSASGTTSTATQSQPQQQGQAGGLFGSQQPTGTGSTGQPSGGLFGSQPQQPQQQQQSTGLFGSTNQQQTQQQPTSLFGSTTQPQQQQQQQQQGGLFGSQTQNKPVQGLQLGGSTSTSNNAQSSGGMTKSTKFTDLPEQHQKMLEQFDVAFRQQRQMVYGTLDQQEDLGSAIRQVIQDVKSAEAECTALELGLAPLRRACEGLSTKVKSEEEDLQRLADIWGSYRPTDGRPSSLRAGALRDFRKQYFRKVVADSEERIPRYKKTILASPPSFPLRTRPGLVIETKLTVQELRRAVDSLQHVNDVPSAQAIAQTIQNHQNAIYTLAAQVEGLEVRWNDVRSFYLQMYRDKTGSIRDPLDVARERQGLPPVRI